DQEAGGGDGQPRGTRGALGGSGLLGPGGAGDGGVQAGGVVALGDELAQIREGRSPAKLGADAVAEGGELVAAVLLDQDARVATGDGETLTQTLDRLVHAGGGIGAVLGQGRILEALQAAQAVEEVADGAARGQGVDALLVPGQALAAD